MLKVISDKNKSLREKSTDVNIPLSKEDRELALELLNYVKLSQNEEFAKKNKIREGVGLAAPQVGVNKKLIGIYYEGVELCLANPKIISNRVRKSYIESGEGCLSVNEDHPGYVIRDYKIVVKAYDVLKDEYVTLTAKGFDACVLQHEIDHLYGILYYDRINKENPFKKVDGAFII